MSVAPHERRENMRRGRIVETSCQYVNEISNGWEFKTIERQTNAVRAEVFRKHICRRFWMRCWRSQQPKQARLSRASSLHRLVLNMYGNGGTLRRINAWVSAATDFVAQQTGLVRGSLRWSFIVWPWISETIVINSDDVALVSRDFLYGEDCHVFDGRDCCGEGAAPEWANGGELSDSACYLK